MSLRSFENFLQLVTEKPNWIGHKMPEHRSAMFNQEQQLELALRMLKTEPAETIETAIDELGIEDASTWTFFSSETALAEVLNAVRPIACDRYDAFVEEYQQELAA